MHRMAEDIQMEGVPPGKHAEIVCYCNVAYAYVS